MVTIDQRKKPPIDGLWVSLGTFHFEKGKSVRKAMASVQNNDTDGFVVIDAVQWLKVKE